MADPTPEKTVLQLAIDNIRNFENLEWLEKKNLPTFSSIWNCRPGVKKDPTRIEKRQEKTAIG